MKKCRPQIKTLNISLEPLCCHLPTPFIQMLVVITSKQASTGIQYTTEGTKPHSYHPVDVFPWRYCNSTRRGGFTGCILSLGRGGKGSIRGKNKSMQCMGTHKPIITNYLFMLNEHRPPFSPIQVCSCEINFVQISFSTSNSFIYIYAVICRRWRN